MGVPFGEQVGLAAYRLPAHGGRAVPGEVVPLARVGEPLILLPGAVGSQIVAVVLQLDPACPHVAVPVEVVALAVVGDPPGLGVGAVREAVAVALGRVDPGALGIRRGSQDDVFVIVGIGIAIQLRVGIFPIGLSVGAGVDHGTVIAISRVIARDVGIGAFAVGRPANIFGIVRSFASRITIGRFPVIGNILAAILYRIAAINRTVGYPVAVPFG